MKSTVKIPMTRVSYIIIEPTVSVCRHIPFLS
jgi:hypothetical protein